MALCFLKIGAVGFGGSVAVIALIRKECVERHHWIKEDEFIHGVGLGQVLGPFAVNAALFIGHRRHGMRGALVAAAAFLMPSLAAVIALSWLYFTYHHIPSLQGTLAGMGPVVIALIVEAAIALGVVSVRSWFAGALALACALAGIGNVPAPVLIGAAGLVGLVFCLGGRNKRAAKPEREPVDEQPRPPEPGHGAMTLLPGAVFLAKVGAVAWVFLKIGFVFFGGGYVLIPLLHRRLVVELGWLSARQFLDGIAISQLTPGPIAVLATFAGFHVAGVAGALAATAALFLPATVLMLIFSHYYQRVLQFELIQHVLAGISPAVVGIIAATAVVLAPANLRLDRPFGLAIGVIALGLLRWGKIPPAGVILLGALAGTFWPALFI